MVAFKKTLVTGGVKSGKSRYALEVANNYSGAKTFIATATASDNFMREKIKKHQSERGGDFLTLEEPLFLAKTLKLVETRTEYLVIDCLTLWTNNLLFHFEDDLPSIAEQITLFVDGLIKYEGHVCVVTNEVGLGIMPDNALARQYSDLLGQINQRTAQVCNEVIMMVAGIPQIIKAVGKSNRSPVQENFYERVNQKV